MYVSDYTPKLKQILREAGCYFDRPGKGDHEFWFSPITRIRAVLKQAGLPKQF